MQSEVKKSLKHLENCEARVEKDTSRLREIKLEYTKKKDKIIGKLRYWADKFYEKLSDTWKGFQKQLTGQKLDPKWMEKTKDVNTEMMTFSPYFKAKQDEFCDVDEHVPEHLHKMYDKDLSEIEDLLGRLKQGELDCDKLLDDMIKAVCLAKDQATKMKEQIERVEQLKQLFDRLDQLISVQEEYTDLNA